MVKLSHSAVCDSVSGKRSKSVLFSSQSGSMVWSDDGIAHRFTITKLMGVAYFDSKTVQFHASQTSRLGGRIKNDK